MEFKAENIGRYIKILILLFTGAIFMPIFLGVIVPYGRSMVYIDPRYLALFIGCVFFFYFYLIYRLAKGD